METAAAWGMGGAPRSKNEILGMEEVVHGGAVDNATVLDAARIRPSPLSSGWEARSVALEWCSGLRRQHSEISMPKTLRRV